MAFTREMAAAARRLKLVQVPGAGLDRIDRGALPGGAALSNAYGHEVGIAEYVLGAMLALTRELGRLDAALPLGVWPSQLAIGGAALDVWYRYPSSPGAAPPAHRPFHELPNVLMTPHVSGWTDGMLKARATLIAENVNRIARGEAPLNRIA